MLVLSRKHLRSVAVEGPNGYHLMLHVTMVELEGGSLRLGLEVNTDSPFLRCEASDRVRISSPSGRPRGPAAGMAGAR